MTENGAGRTVGGLGGVEMLVAALVLLTAQAGNVGDAVKVGDVVHLTGCEDLGSGPELVVPQVNVWALPAGGLASGQSVVGRLSGGNPRGADRCSGAAVNVREVRETEGRLFMKVQAIRTPLTGWVTAGFAGKRFDRARCDTTYGNDPAALARCKGK